MPVSHRYIDRVNGALPRHDRMNNKSKYYRIGSLEKGIRIVELLSKQGAMSLSEVAAEL